LIVLPFLKVFLLSPHESINRGDVLKMALSFYAGGVVIVLIDGDSRKSLESNLFEESGHNKNLLEAVRFDKSNWLFPFEIRGSYNGRRPIQYDPGAAFLSFSFVPFLCAAGSAGLS